jgi:hypothetical protein
MLLAVDDAAVGTTPDDTAALSIAITGVEEQPEIEVRGNGIVIADGDSTPSPEDDTDFGSVIQEDAGLPHTFTVRNDGQATLILGPVVVPEGFTVTEGLSATLAAGAWDTFTIQLDTAAVGTWSGEVSFETNDPDENPFHFQITGTVVARNLAWHQPTTASTSYRGYPAANATDGSLSSRWSSQVSGDGSHWSDLYSTTTGDGGVDDLTLAAPGSGRYVRLLGIQRGTVYGYSLWEFEVYG